MNYELANHQDRYFKDPRPYGTQKRPACAFHWDVSALRSNASSPTGARQSRACSDERGPRLCEGLRLADE